MMEKHLCVFSERVTICEGGVDISDSDDEDESKFFLFSYEVVVSDILTLQWFTKKRDAGVLCKASLCSLRACMAFFFLRSTQKLRSLSPGAAAHHQIRALVSLCHLLFCWLLFLAFKL